MTKLKNTKKGMAKKALSISLVAAMLATSNVPVWAADMFSDGTDAVVEYQTPEDEFGTQEDVADAVAPVAEIVEEADAGIELQAASDYTVETNVELKTADGTWASVLQLAKKEGTTGDAALTISKGNETITPDKIEVYYNRDLVGGQAITLGDTEKSIAGINAELKNLGAPNVNVYKGGKEVALKVYVAGETTPVATFNYILKAVDITDRTDIRCEGTKSFDYNGNVQYPTGVIVGSTAKQSEGKITVGYEKTTDGINKGSYAYYAEGVETEGYIGRTKLCPDTEKVTINAVTPSVDNLSIVVSGDATYSGSAQIPTSVVVTDKTTGAVIPSELFEVTADGNTAVGTYDSAVSTVDGTKHPLNVSVSMKADNGKTGDKLVENNFAAGNVTATGIITGSYAITKLDLGTLTSKYDITVKPQVKTSDNGYTITTGSLILKDKATGKEVATNSVLPDTVSAPKVTLPAGVTSGTVNFTSTDTANVTGTLQLSFNVVGAEITKEKVYLPKGTLVNGVDICEFGKYPLSDKTINEKITAALTAVYDGTEKKPLENVFGKLVQAGNNVDGTDVVYTLGTDYDVIYTNNINSDAAKAVSSEEGAKVTLRFKGNYTGEIEYPIAISQAEVAATAKPLNYQAGVSTYEANADLTIGTGTSKKDVPATAYVRTATTKATKVGDPAVTTYKLIDKNYKWATTQTTGITVTNDTATVSATVLGKSLKDESISAQVIGTYTYNGKPITPTLEVKDGTTVLKENTDYKVISKSGTEAGEASVTIQGMGNYSNKDQLVIKYNIEKADIKDAAIVSGKDASKDKTKETNYDQPYNGQVQAPDIATIKIGSQELKPYDETAKTGDFVLTYDENAKELGTYNFTLTSAASSTKVQGTISGTYKVVPAKLSAQFVKKSDAKYTGNTATQMTPNANYSGKEITIEDLKTRYVVVNDQSAILTEGKDYRLEYENNVDAGKATVYAYGLGNYAYVEDGKEVAIASANFIIEGIDTITSDHIIAVADTEYAGGLAVEPKVTVKIGNKTLVQGTDYTVKTTVTEVKDGYEASDVTVYGKGAYIANGASGKTNDGVSGTLSTIKWNVTKKDIKNTTITVDGENVSVMNGTVLVPSNEYDVEFSEDGKKVTVTAKATSKNYTGSQEKSTDAKAVGTPVIKEVKVTNNKANIILSGDVDNASGYDYVVSTVNDYKNGRVAFDKNQVATQSTIQYLQKGEYYAYLHAWKRVDGKKVFGGWSNIVKFTVTTTTPDQPLVTSVTRSGSTVKVTYTKTKDATGYDIVLGSKVKKVNGESRPVEYGKLVKKVYSGNTVTATFKNVPKGTYYAGLHAYNRTSVNNSKVFSPWSNTKKVVVR